MKKLLLIPAVLFAILLVVVWSAGCTLILGPSTVPSAQSRWEQLDTTALPLNEKVTISWDKYAVPFITAEDDADAFFALGFAQAHLRLGQMELLRRAVQGRLSEMVGPLAHPIDEALRIIDVDGTAAGILASLPAEERAFVERFAEGINVYLERSPTLPFEFRAFDLERTPWSAEDVVRVSRPASVDFTWILYASFLLIEDEYEREAAWGRFLSLREKLHSQEATTSPAVSSLFRLFESTGRLGSNSAVVAGARTASGSPLILSDPHLGISVPNFWLIAGMKSPSFNVVGLMIPGTPFFALGRNADAAWGGTNLRAISSHLYKLKPDELAKAKEKKESISTRWWFDKEISWRETNFGPLLSDAEVFSEKPAVALNWLGHRSDGKEFSAFLNLARVTTWESFRDNFKDYLVPGLVMVYAGKDGDIGALAAYSQPVLGEEHFSTLTKDPEEAGQPSLRRQQELPYVLNPADDYIVSTNNGLRPSTPPTTFLPPVPTRHERLSTLLREHTPIDREKASMIQRDTLSLTSLRLKRKLVSYLRTFLNLPAGAQRVVDLLEEWDGRYSIDSVGALAFEYFAHALLDELFAEEKYLEKERPLLMRGGLWKAAVAKEIDAGGFGEQTSEALLLKTSKYLRENGSWGIVQRHLLQYPLGNVPFLGRQYRFKNLPAPGAADSIYKAGGSFDPDGTKVRFGSQSRHVSDLSDPNENYFVLFGGQDGWLESPNLLDQVPLWQKGEYVRVPLGGLTEDTDVVTATLLPQ